MFYDILDKTRIEILPKLKIFKDRFYLAGGTGLALQIGHRDSVDFDFFISKDFDTTILYKELLDIFLNGEIVKTLEEKNSLNVFINEEIKLSFLKYSYPLLDSTLDEENFTIASVIDIGCMKLSAIVGRAMEKDYVDLYFILQKISLQTLLEKAKKKMPDLDSNLILKSLIYFDDITPEQIQFKNNFHVSIPEIKLFLEIQIKTLKIQ